MSMIGWQRKRTGIDADSESAACCFSALREMRPSTLSKPGATSVRHARHARIQGGKKRRREQRRRVGTWRWLCMDGSMFGIGGRPMVTVRVHGSDDGLCNLQLDGNAPIYAPVIRPCSLSLTSSLSPRGLLSIPVPGLHTPAASLLGEPSHRSRGSPLHHVSHLVQVSGHVPTRTSVIHLLPRHSFVTDTPP
ncbi:hypothetical protein BV20DRAFT_297288 [Pilatotrama ljubarskyi]|nr:hypothetical protein BV20DRAFT_297288 [Pilatotrama ljubarskyi]